VIQIRQRVFWTVTVSIFTLFSKHLLLDSRKGGFRDGQGAIALRSRDQKKGKREKRGEKRREKKEYGKKRAKSLAEKRDSGTFLIQEKVNFLFISFLNNPCLAFFGARFIRGFVG